jgi:hypothetical protein
MPPMVTNQGHAEAFRNPAVNEVVWESFQIAPVEPWLDRMKPARVGERHGDDASQLRLEVIG